MILVIFDLQVTPMLPTKFRVNWLLGLEEEVKNRFSRWPPMLPTKFGVNWLLVEEKK